MYRLRVPLSGPCLQDTSALSGTHTLKLRITDKANNVTESAEQSVTVDQSKDVPRISQAFVAAPLPSNAGLNVLGALLKVSGTLSDDDGYLGNSLEIFLDGSPTALTGTNSAGTTVTWEYTWASLAPGEHYLTLRATDRNGAVANLGPTYFVVDTANPIISLNTPSAGAKIKAGLLEISGTALDDGGFGTNPLRIELRHSNSSSSIDGDVNTPALVGNTFTFTVPIDSAVLDGTLFIDLILSDRSGKQSSLTRAVTIDTTPPSLNLNYPSPGAYINGLVSIVGTADDINGLGELSLKVLDPLNLAIEKANVTRSGTTLSSWEFPFNATSYASATFAHDVNGDGKLWQVWFKLKATDNSGNITELKTGPGPLDYPSFFIDTDGDKPTISVTQPKNGDKIGGFVNMFGTATDDDGPVMQVEVQIDYNGDGDFADSMDINSNGSTQLGVNKTMVPSTTVVRVGDPAQKWEDESAWYEVPVTNGSWTLELNAAGELYKSKTGGTGDLIIRVRSRDMFGLASEISTRTITLDETFPRIDNVSPADQSYQSGDLPLFAEFGDNINLNLSLNSQIKININKTGYQTLSAGPNSGPGHPYSLIADLAEPQNGYDLNYTINTNNYFPGSSGILYVDLYVKDESNYTNQRSFTYYVDNQIPSAAWSDRPGSPDGLNIRNGQVRINGNPALDYAFVEGNFLDSGAVSGISRIELYFVKAGQVQRIRGTSGALSPASSETVSVDEYNEGNGTWSSSTQNLPIVRSSDAGYGDDYVISIDRPTEMSSLSTGTDSDGDSYYEFMGIDGGSQRWRALFNSSYLPDGSIDIHYVVYDLAGNRIHKVRRGFIANQGPSYTRIRLGSDYNNGGTIADVPGAVTEIVDYYNPSLSIDRLASSSPVRVKNGRVYFNVQSNDPNGTIASTVINIVAPSPGTRGLLASLGAGSNVASSTTTPITLSIGSGQFPSAGDYTLEVVVKDNDGITSRRNVVISLLPTSDTTRPIVSPTAMTQANGVYISGDGTPMDPFVKEGHLELQADNPAKWATIRSQYGSDDDPKVSGKVTLKGTISDETRIDEVNITGDGLGTNAVVAQWNAVQGKLISSNGNFIIDSQSMDESEHRISYTFIWDTSTATGTAALNRTVAFQAKDSATLQNISLAHTLLRYDVVPYITTLKRDAAFNTLRSRYGRFLFHRGETLSVHGFNVFNSNADTVSLGGASINLPGGSTKTLATVTVPAAAKSGIVNLSVNGILALNNLNDNDKAWNIEASAVPGIDGSTYWNDDRYLHLWQSDDKQTGTDRGYFAGSIDPEYPAMTIDTSGTNSVLYGSWSNYATSSVNYVGNNSNFTLGTNRIGSSYDPIEHTDIAYGNRPGVIYNANTYGNGVWELTGAGGVVVWDSQADSAISVTGNGYEVEYLYHDRRLMQFTGQRIAYQNNNIHVSYYDTETKALKYWYTASNGNVGYSARWINIDGGFDAQDGDFTEVYGLPGTNGATITNIYVASGVTVTNNQNVMRDSDGNIYRANANGVVDIPISVGSRLANGNDERSILFSIRISTNRIVDYNANPSLSSRAAAAGEFSAIDTTPTTNYPVIAYYDITNRTVRIARASAVNPNATQWTLQDAMLPGDPNRSFSGKYISMKIDSSGYVHLAFYRNSTGDLIYMKSTNNPTNGTTAYTFGDSVIVDSIGSVGIWADLSLNGTTPYISYIDSSYVNSFDGIKMAYYDAALNGWEIMNAPLSFEVENVRTSIESNTKAGDFWSAAIGYSSPDYFRIAYYVKE
ncbi:hypothetical protein MASR2M78_10290 [Treponema sp.]